MKGENKTNSNPTTQSATRKAATPKKAPTAAEILKAYAAAQERAKALQTEHTEKPTKTTARKFATAEKRLAALANAINEMGIITAETVQTIGERIAVKALKTCLQSGGKPNENKPTNGGNFNFLYSLYCDLITDINKRKTDHRAPLSDGYDIAQTATAFLCGYIGKTLHDNADNGETDKNGNPVDVSRACFRAVNRYIMGERQRIYKRAYVDETDANGKTLYYEIPDEWDIPTANDFRAVNDMITALKLSQNEKRFLSYRLRGFSLETIAQKMGISRGNVNTYRQRIKAKAQNVPPLAPYCKA